ncbi:MAG: hypothetical protein R3C42_07905 [Parvularculaceae bacterium]
MSYEENSVALDDDLSNAVSAQQTAQPGKAPGRENEFVAPEVAGDAPVGAAAGGESDPADENAEIENAAGEAGEFSFEAAPAALAQAADANSAISDLRGIEGFEEPSGEESAAEADFESLEDAGTALAGGETADMEFGFLAALLPTLASAAAPKIIHAVSRKISSKTRRRIKRFARPAKSIAAAAVSAKLSKSNVLSLLAKLLAEAETAPMGESASETEEAIATEVAAAMEVIIGTDDRIRINGTTNTPWRRFCALKIYFKGATYRGTDFHRSARGHPRGRALRLPASAHMAGRRRSRLTTGANGALVRNGDVDGVSRSVRGWVVERKPSCDYGCIVLPQGSFGGRNLGQFGFAAFPPQTLLAQPAILAGFPGDKPFAELWGMSRRIKTVTPDRLVYDIDSMGGQSGSPIYIKRNGERYVVGIHNYGASSGNSATRVTQSVYRRLQGWRQL